MIDILHNVAFDSATQTLRYEFWANFNFSSNWEIFSKKPSEHQELFAQLSFTVENDKKNSSKTQISRKLCPNFDDLCINDRSKYLVNSSAKIFDSFPNLRLSNEISKFCNFKNQLWSRMSHFWALILVCAMYVFLPYRRHLTRLVSFLE